MCLNLGGVLYGLIAKDTHQVADVNWRGRSESPSLPLVGCCTVYHTVAARQEYVPFGSGLEMPVLSAAEAVSDCSRST